MKYSDVLQNEAAISQSLAAAPEAVQLFYQLVFDCLKCSTEAVGATDEYHRRNFVRGAFACIEGVGYVIRQYALKLHASRPDLYNAAELSHLKEETYRISSGEAKAHQNRSQPLDETLAFSINMLMRAIAPNFKLDVSGAEWKCFTDGVKIRNRITHPRQLADLKLSESDIETAMCAWAWVMSVVFDCGLAFLRDKEKEAGIEGLTSGQPMFAEMKAWFNAVAVVPKK
jgi:hypothetical protein